MSDRENCILIDWFAMSFRGFTVDEVKAVLGLPFDVDWINLSGRYFYRDRVSFGHIHIYYNNINPACNYPLLELTGQGCREFETYNPAGFRYLFDLAKDPEKYNMSRLDVSFDDFEGILDARQIFDDYHYGNWVSSSNRGLLAGDMHRREKDHVGYSVTTGSKSSDMYMRIYDKAIERGYFDGRQWVRCELTLKQDRAYSFIRNPSPLGEKYRGVIAKYFRFVTPSKKDSNKWRWNTRKYWLDFLDNVAPISVFTPKNIDYNLYRLHHYVMQQAGNSVETYIRCVGLFDFFERLKDRGTKGLTPKQRFLVQKFDRMDREKKHLTLKELEEILENFGVSIDQTAPESTNAEQLPTDPEDPFADIPIPEPPEGWNDDS